MPIVSVVIPVYNVQDYLAQSVQSVREQSLADIEIILVNDGSTDMSGRIAAQFAAVDPRIVLVNKDNGGLSSARNAGIKVAKGDFVCFLDSDDLMMPDACETIATAFGRTDADVVTYGAVLYPEFVSIPWMLRTLNPRDVEYKEFHSDLLFKEASSPFVWRTACRLSFLREIGLTFDESLPFGEDQVFQFQLYPRTKHTVLISNKLVKYRVVRPGSFMDTHAYEPLRLAKDHVDISRRIIADWSNIGFLQSHALESLDWLADFSFLRTMQLDGRDREEVLDSIERVLLTYFSKEDLLLSVKQGAAGSFVNAIVFDKTFRCGSKRRQAVYSYYLKAEGKRAVLRRILHVFGQARVFSSIRDKAKSLSKDDAHDRQLAEQRRQWEQQDLEDRREANAILEREYQAAAESKIGIEEPS